MTEPSLIPYFHRGAWRQVPDPLPSKPEDLEEALHSAGFTSGLQPLLGSDPDTMTIQVAHGPDEDPRFYLAVTLATSVHSVLAGDVADLMDLLARWVPAVQMPTLLEVRDKFDEVAAAVGSLDRR